MTSPEYLRAITIRQPWASAIFMERAPKDIENRTWGTSYRGRLFIHAARKVERDAPDHAWPGGRNADLPVQAIIGHVIVANCTFGDQPGRWASPGQFHWWLSEPVALPSPVPCPGKLGIWLIPGDIAAQLS